MSVASIDYFPLVAFNRTTIFRIAISLALKMKVLVDDDMPRVPNPLEDCLASAQQRRYLRDLYLEGINDHYRCRDSAALSHDQ